MTRSETPKAYSPRRLKLDKENVHSSSKKATPSPIKRSLRTSTGSMTGSPPGIQLRTPPGSSKLLRQHFQNLSMSSSGRRRRLMDTGPVRLLSPRQCRIIGSEASSPSKDGNSKVLRSRGNDEESSTDQSFGSNGIDWTLPSSSTPPRRMDCMDPVAFTLLKGGDEDRSWLIEQDRSFVIPKVSDNLSDVYGDYTREMARPVALFARRQM